LLGEDVADLAGLRVAFDAYHLSLHGRPDRTINGLTGDQRFFLAFAHRWQMVQSEDALRKQVAKDIHAPGPYRAGTVRNLDAWYAAFGVVRGDRLYLDPKNRIGIW
jgi:putative endopeptidase